MRINLDNFEKMLNVSKYDFSNHFLNYYDTIDLNFSIYNQFESLKLIKNFINRIYTDNLSVSGTHRKTEWHEGWSENLTEISKKSFDPKFLIPKYINSNKPLRYERNFIKQESENLEWKISNLINFYIYSKYFSEFDNIYEFGCGSCGNIYELAKLFPKKKIYGLDWVKSSIDILNILKHKFFENINGEVFDFFEPNFSMQIPKSSAFFTHGALEQLGDNFNNFFEFIFDKQPDIIVNVECDNYLYDKSNLIDYLSDKYHTKRNYLNNYILFLNNLEKKRKIKILEKKRTFFGSQYHEVYNIFAFRIIK